jgi:hypothetical protein
LSTRQVQAVALLVGVVVLAGGFLVVSRHKSNSPSTASSTPVTTLPAASTPTQTTPAPNKAHTLPATPVDTHGLPVPVALALRKHSIVIVSLSTPRGEDSQLAAAEAQSAAGAMGAGYVNLNVYRQRPGTAILRKLGVLDTPATLVVKRPGAVYSDFKGFVDRVVVEQAVADARS